MFFNLEHRLVFFFPMKTGSTSFRNYLARLNSGVFLKNIHGVPSDLVKLHPEICQYKAYAFLRNPISRLVSMLAYVKKYWSESDADQVKKIIALAKNEKIEPSKDAVDVYFRRMQINSEKVFTPQYKYFEGMDVTPLNFNDFENEIKQATLPFGTNNIVIQRDNASNSDDLNIDKQVLIKWLEPFVEYRYPTDCALWRTTMNLR